MKHSCEELKANSKKSKIKHVELSQPGVPIFSSLKFYVLPAHFGLGRLNIFNNQIIKYGGTIVESLDNNFDKVNYIIVEETLDRVKIMKLIKEEVLKNVLVVKCPWVSNCIKAKKLVDASEFAIEISLELLPSKVAATIITCSSSSNIINDNEPHTNVSSQSVAKESSPSKNEDAVLSIHDCLGPLGKLQSKFACAHPSNSGSSHQSPNSHITAELQKLLEVYQAKNDTWRVTGYQKAIAAINACPHEIKSYEDALSIRGVGSKLAAKVWEVVSSGQLRKVSEVCGSEETTVVNLFLGVWGAGPTTAAAWYTQGFRTLKDLRDKATLTRHQRIGLQHYEDFNDRIPREEVAQIHHFVQQCCTSLHPGLVSEVCGSYRRGRVTCGDVDVLVTHPDGRSHEGVFQMLLDHMRRQGFLTDDLVTQEDGNQQKYLGVCRLPGDGSKHRRLDVIVVPYSEYAPALLYFTGSAHFNRSMRLLAIKLGMSLSEHGLRSNVVRKGHEKLTSGCLLPTPTEESIFEHLGLPYRAPPDRDH